MNTDDWIKISAACSSPVSVFVGLWLNYRISSNKDIATLELELDNSEDCVSISECDYGDDYGMIPRCHVRFKLNIKGSTNGVKKCSVKLLRITRLDSNSKETQLLYPNKKPLLWNTEWGSGSYVEKDLPHGTEQYVDLLHTQLIEEIVSVKITDVGFTPIGLLMGNTYRFEVQATAGNAKAVGRIVEIKLGQIYSDIMIKRSRILKV